MTDRELAQLVTDAQRIAATCQAHYRERAKAGDEDEADVALGAFRLAMPLRRALESWMQNRAMRAVLGRRRAAS